MEVLHDLEPLAGEEAPATLALGMFDGVHLGHQAVLARTREKAKRVGARAGVVTFDPHPQRIIAPPPAPMLLTTIEERVDLFARSGIDLSVVLTFDQTFRHTPPDAWLKRLARAARGGVVASASYTFGEDRRGTAEMLRQGGTRLGFGVTIVPPVHVAGTLVSSTLIRRLVRAGQMEDAASYLGRPYALRGTVVEGMGRGRTLGFPTANLDLHPDKVLPAKGIYAGRVRVPDGIHAAAISVGVRPTFGHGALQVEAYLLEFEGDLYGREIELVFASRLRDELAFGTVAELVAQIFRDVEEVRERIPPVLE